MVLKVFRLLLALVGLMTLSVYGQLRLKERHPDEPASYTFNQRFSAQNALEKLKQIDNSLQNFRQLTEQCGRKLPKEELVKIENIGPDAQTLGFYNWVRAVEETVRKQEYQIKKLEYD